MFNNNFGKTHPPPPPPPPPPKKKKKRIKAIKKTNVSKVLYFIVTKYTLKFSDLVLADALS
jgi:hypothetical protein